MDVIATTPFGQRPVSAGQLEHQALATARAEIPHFDKWQLFRELCVARLAYGVTDRDLTVLNALLSFLPGKNLSDNEDMIVFPSNAALSERAHGMAESTLRRHLAALVGAGLVLRQDSPNGKRYASRDGSGAVVRAYGFNLRPLLVQAAEIGTAAAETRAAAETYRRVRSDCSVLLRDVVKLSEYGMSNHPSDRWSGLLTRITPLARALRRKLSLDALRTLCDDLRDLLSDVQGLLGMVPHKKTTKMDGNDGDSGRHYQNSNTDHSDLEPPLEKEEAAGVVAEQPPLPQSDKSPRIPIGLVLKSCPDILDYAKHGIEDWYDLISTAEFIRAMMGISPDAWTQAKREMGPENAAIVLAALLQKVDDIHSPGGYLRALTSKAADGAFSPGPMVMALLNGGGQRAA